MASIKNGKVFIDSLSNISNVPDKILPIVLKGEFDEIKRRGDASTLTPAAALIINVGVRNGEKRKFDFTTLFTQKFAIYDD